MYDVRMDASGLRSWAREAERRLYPLVMHALQRTVAQAAAYARTSTLYKSHTYRLRGSIQGAVTGAHTGLGNAPMMGRVVATAPYASFVENGTRAHMIFPRRARVLRFEVAGQTRFARFVQHPGTKPRPFMAEAQHRAQPLFERLMQEAFVKAFA